MILSHSSVARVVLVVIVAVRVRLDAFVVLRHLGDEGIKSYRPKPKLLLINKLHEVIVHSCLRNLPVNCVNLDSLQFYVTY